MPLYTHYLGRMEGLKTGFLLRARFFQCKALMVCFLPLLLLMAMLSPTLMPTIWHALTGFLQGPAFAFLLLNCVIATIIGSSKLDSERRGHEEESLEQLAMGLLEEGDEKGKDGVESSSIGQSFCLNTPSKNGHNHHKKKEEGFLRRLSCSLNSSSEYQTKHEQVKARYKKEKKPISSRAKLARRKNDKAGDYPTKPLGTELQKRQLLTKGSLTSSHSPAISEDAQQVKPALAVNNLDTTADDHCTKGHSSTGHAVDLTDHQQWEAQNPANTATTAHPSMDEVWAAIMSSKKSDDRMGATSGMQAEKPGRTPDSKNSKQPLPATSTGAPIQAVSALHTQPAAAATAATSLRAAYKAAPKWDELKEVNRRAEQFISRFNRQMRLQQEEPWQRQKRERQLVPFPVGQVPHQ